MDMAHKDANNATEARLSAPLSGNRRVHVRPMGTAEALPVARCHQEGIPNGVLSELGTRFMTHLYTAIAQSEHGFVVVAVAPSDDVVGFVCGTTNLKAIFRSVVIRHGWPLLGVLLRHVLSWRMVRRVAEVVFYPSKLDKELPQAELLSIVVDGAMRGCGVADELMEAFLVELRRRGYRKTKVVVGAHLGRAIAYYTRHGFQLAQTITSHGHPTNVYVKDI